MYATGTGEDLWDVEQNLRTYVLHTRTRSGTSTSSSESRPLALRDEETAGAVTRDPVQQMKAGAI